MILSAKFWSPRRRLVAVAYACQVFAIIGVMVYWDPWFLILTAAGVFLFVSVGLECYMHRYVAHQSYEMSRAKQVFAHWCGFFALQGPALMWAPYHITHHKFSDKEGDPHPSEGGWRSWAWVNNHSAASVNTGTVRRLVKDPLMRFTNDWYLRLYIAIVASVALIEVKVAIYLFLLPATAAFHIAGVTTVVLHRHGYRNFETPDHSHNMMLANLFAGSPLHNNHHANPGRYDDAIKPGEWDFHGAVIRNLLMERA